VDELKVDHTLDLAQKKMIRWNQLIECHYLKRGLFLSGSLQHDQGESKTPS
jgi:hypothetical protein